LEGVLLHCTVVDDRLLGVANIFTEFQLESTGPYLRSNIPLYFTLPAFTASYCNLKL
jgi:hypothetical protein